MIRSMTGYGRGDASDEELSLTVEIKSVNHRFFEATVKAPRQLAFAEDKLKSYVQSRIARGKIDILVSADFKNAGGEKTVVNEQYAADYIESLKLLAKKFRLKNDISVMKVAQNDNIFTTTHIKFDEDKATALVNSAAKDAVDRFIAARETEGKHLADDVLSRTDFILDRVAEVEKTSPKSEAAYRERIESKIKELLGSTQIDEQRVLTEVAIFSDRIAVNEETVRLRSHVDHMRELFETGGVIGKKLDFIVQEMNREANTIGSKCQDLEITKTVVEIKSEIEKIREQIQNIE